MKKTLLLALSFSAFSAYSQDAVWDALGTRQNGLKEVSSSSPNDLPPASSTEKIPGSKETICKGDTQESLPLGYVSKLFQEAPARMNFEHDPDMGTLKITTGGMIDNCSSLLDWNLNKISGGGRTTYAVEAKFQKGKDCTKNSDNKEFCTYTISKIVDGEVKDIDFAMEPNQRGLAACLKETGVLTPDGINPKAMKLVKTVAKFDNVKETGDLVFVSTGKPLSNTKPKFGKDFLKIDGCSFYENVDEDGVSLLSSADQTRITRDAEADKLKSCTVNDYYKLTQFIDNYQEYSSTLGAIRDNLILQAAAKSAKAITDGKYTADDLKVIEDFDKYIVEPKVEAARALYNEMASLDGDAKKAKQAELKAALDEVKKLNSAPYYTVGNTQKLLNDGKFDDAENLNSMKLVLQNNSQLGQTVNNVLVTPEVATVRIVQSQNDFKDSREELEEKYQIRTGQSSGQAQAFANQVKQLTQVMQTNNQAFSEAIQTEIACMTNSAQAKQMCTAGGGKYCYAGWFRNAQKCVQEGQSRVALLQQQLQEANKVIQEQSTEAGQKAQEYLKLENEGRRYIASQNGEAAPADLTLDLTVPQVNTSADAVNNTFNFNNPQAQQYQQQMMSQQQQYNPWSQYTNGVQQYPMQNNFMGQQNYTWNGGYNMYQQPNYTMNGQYNMSYQQPMYSQYQQNMGFWSQPNAAYSNYNMYSGVGQGQGMYQFSY